MYESGDTEDYLKAKNALSTLKEIADEDSKIVIDSRLGEWQRNDLELKLVQANSLLHAIGTSIKDVADKEGWVLDEKLSETYENLNKRLLFVRGLRKQIIDDLAEFD